MQKPIAAKGEICPFHRKDVSKVCHTCPMYVHIRGTNPNTGEEVDNWRCSFSWLPVLMIENSQQQRQTGAAVESFRNEMVKANQVNQRVLVSSLSGKSPKSITGA